MRGRERRLTMSIGWRRRDQDVVFRINLTKNSNMAKLLYTMGEVADMLSEAPSAVRYWSNYFEKYVKPQRNAKGNRLYHPEDIETLKQIQFMVKKQGLTLDGAMQKMREDHRSVDRRVKALDSLKAIREQLVAVREVICK